jgi:hypothetical protein
MLNGRVITFAIELIFQQGKGYFDRLIEMPVLEWS